MPALDPLLQGRRALLLIAAPIEARAALAALHADPDLARREWEPLQPTERLDLVISGVGKANAAGAAARWIDPERHALVISLGIGGALPRSQLDLASVRAASRSAFADEGLITDEGFADLARMGFPPMPGGGVAFPSSPEALSALREIAPPCPCIATVSTCAGTDERAEQIARRADAQIEAMEGAAVALACARLGAPFIEIRAVSNTCGARARQRWDLPGALTALSRVVAAL